MQARVAEHAPRYRLRAEPVRWLGWEYRVHDGDAEIARLDLARLRGRARFASNGVEYEVAREGLLAGRYVLRANGRVIARTERASLVPNITAVIAEDRQLALRMSARLRLKFRVLHGDREIGRIHKPQPFRRTLALELTEPLPPHLRLFLLTVALFILRSRARAAGSAGG